MTAGILTGLLYFLTQLQQIIPNETFYRIDNPASEVIKQPFSVFFKLLDFRYFILIPAILPLLKIFPKQARPHPPSLFLIGAFFLPFLFFALHDPELAQRIWVVLLPVFCIGMTQLSIPFFLQYRQLIPVYGLLNIAALITSLLLLRTSTLHNNRENKITFDLKNQYHLFGFNPNTALTTAVSRASREHMKIQVRENFPAGIRFYMRYFPIDSLNTANQHSERTILVTDRLLNAQTPAAPDSLRENDLHFYKLYLF